MSLVSAPCHRIHAPGNRWVHSNRLSRGWMGVTPRTSRPAGRRQLHERIRPLGIRAPCTRTLTFSSGSVRDVSIRTSQRFTIAARAMSCTPVRCRRIACLDRGLPPADQWLDPRLELVVAGSFHPPAVQLRRPPHPRSSLNKGRRRVAGRIRLAAGESVCEVCWLVERGQAVHNLSDLAILSNDSRYFVWATTRRSDLNPVRSTHTSA